MSCPFRRAAALALLLLVSCSSSTSDVARSIGAAKLQDDGRYVLSRLAAREGPPTDAIPVELWPESFHQLHALEVRPHMLGVLIVTERVDQEDRGLYVVTENAPDEEQNPERGEGLHYEKIDRGVFWCRVLYRSLDQSREPFAIDEQ